MRRAADPPSNAPPPGPPDAAAESSPSAASPLAQTASRPPRLALLIATGFGAGDHPVAPGTWGSLLGLILAWGFRRHQFESPFVHNPYIPIGEYEVDPWVFKSVLIVVAVALLGVWVSKRVAHYLGAKDPQRIVIDEISGQMIALLSAGWLLTYSTDDFTGGPRYIVLMSPNWQYLLAGFILFRVFDIWKPWPVRSAEKLPGGWGIMADDWVAGIYAALCLWLLREFGM